MNKDLLSKLFIFAAGAVIGSAVTYIYTRRKYEQVEWEYEEETEEENPEDDVEKNVEKEEKQNKQDMVQYNKFVKQYSGNSLMDEIEKEVEDVDRPYLITVDEYAELDDYETVSLYYYEDNVLTDELGNVIDDADDAVGVDNLKKFDDMKVDSIYVRNDARMSDYEILRDMGRYYDEHPREE